MLQQYCSALCTMGTFPVTGKIQVDHFTIVMAKNAGWSSEKECALIYAADVVLGCAAV